MRSARREGFSLLEMLGVMALLLLVFTVAVNLFLDLSRQSQAGVERARIGRRATGLLDRMARDLSAAVLVERAPEEDPLAHPWLFLAEARDEDRGAERLKFTMRGHRPRSDGHESDLAVVSWVMEENEGFEEGLTLWRHASPRLPDGLDRSFPSGELDGAQVMADDLEDFGVRFLDEEGNWRGRWDSSTFEDSGSLPLMAEIHLAFRASGGAARDEAEAGPERFTRHVLLPVRPLDLAELFQRGAAGAEEDSGEGMTLAECRAQNPAAFEAARATLEVPLDDAELESVLGLPYAQAAAEFDFSVEGCE